MHLESLQNWFNNNDLTKGQSTQIRIIQSALELFSHKGYANISLQAIAESSNTSHPLILKHFGSKDGLLLHVRSYVKMSNQVWVDRKIKPDMDAREALFVHCFENLRWVFEKPAEGRMIILTYYYNSLSQSTENISLNARALGTQRVLKYVLQAQREGFLKGDVKPLIVAEMVQESLIGLGIAILTGGQLDRSKIPPSYKKKVQILLGGFLEV